MHFWMTDLMTDKLICYVRHLWDTKRWDSIHFGDDQKVEATVNQILAARYEFRPMYRTPVPRPVKPGEGHYIIQDLV